MIQIKWKGPKRGGNIRYIDSGPGPRDPSLGEPKTDNTTFNQMPLIL